MILAQLVSSRGANTGDLEPEHVLLRLIDTALLPHNAEEAVFSSGTESEKPLFLGWPRNCGPGGGILGGRARLKALHLTTYSRR